MPPTLCSSALEDRLRDECGQRRLLRRLPDDGVAAYQRERSVPAPNRNRKVERRDNSSDPKRMPGLHHAMIRALRGRVRPGELARESGGKGADIDHLLYFAKPFREDLSCFKVTSRPSVIAF